MAKLNKPYSTGEIEEIAEVKVDTVSTQLYNENDRVRLRSLYDARLTYTGQASGKQYVWNKAGSVVEVEMLDSEYLLAKRLGGTSCCGSSKDGMKIFEIAN